MNAPLGVILAGGQSRRMGGGDKGRLEINGQTLLSRVMERLAPQVAQMVLNANGDAARFDDLGLPVIGDSITGFAGPLAGVLAGLDYGAQAGFDTIVTVAADTPFFPCDLVPRLQWAAQEMDNPLALAATDEKDPPLRHPTFGLWPVALRDDLRHALEGGLRKVVAWTDQHGAKTAVFPHAQEPFFNVNTPQDLALAEQR